MGEQFTAKELDLLYDALFLAIDNRRTSEKVMYRMHPDLSRKAKNDGMAFEILRAKVNGLRNEHLIPTDPR